MIYRHPRSQAHCLPGRMLRGGGTQLEVLSSSDVAFVSATVFLSAGVSFLGRARNRWLTVGEKSL
jgi:hypothetical protein